MGSTPADSAFPALDRRTIFPDLSVALDALSTNRFTCLEKINFEFCICIYSNLCYRVFIPVVEKVLQAGSSLRHWPPGTDSSTVRAVFFFQAPFVVPTFLQVPFQLPTPRPCPPIPYSLPFPYLHLLRRLPGNILLSAETLNIARFRVHEVPALEVQSQIH